MSDSTDDLKRLAKGLLKVAFKITETSVVVGHSLYKEIKQANVEAKRKSYEENKTSANSFYTKVAGVSIGDRQHIIAGLKQGDELLLIRERDNKYDKNAIKICTLQGKQIGYIPAELAVNMAKKIDIGEQYTAKIEKITGGGELYYGVNLKIRSTTDSGLIQNKRHSTPVQESAKTRQSTYVNKSNYYDDDGRYDTWTDRDYNEYYTGDPDNYDWDYPEN